MTEFNQERLPWGRLTGIRPVKRANVFLHQGCTRLEAEQKFAQEFGADPDRSRRAVDIACRENRLLSQAYPDGISLYIGIPFCPSRCVYCSFISFSVERSADLMEPYLAALEQEIHAGAEIVRRIGKRIETVYIGGGTPTTLSARQMERLLKAVHREFDLSGCKEFTVEAGRPDTVTEEKLTVMKHWGVTRISLNPQSMNQEILDRIGRRHTPEDIIAAFAMARKAGFHHINMDVIAGLPDESYPMFCHTLQELFSLEPEGITVHTMSVKRASVLKQNQEEYDLTAREVVGKMLDYAWAELEPRGYFPYYLYRQKYILGGYENTGFAKPGKECLYNVYIMEETQSILSLGAGGSTKIVEGDRIERIFNVKEPTEYIKRVDEMIARKQKIEAILKGGDNR